MKHSTKAVIVSAMLLLLSLGVLAQANEAMDDIMDFVSAGEGKLMDHGCPDQPHRCHEWCRNHGYGGGRCNGRRCNCYRAANEAMDDIMDFVSAGEGELMDHGCPSQPHRCHEWCRSRGYRGGRCNGHECRCYR